jgi:hypothetical protein
MSSVRAEIPDLTESEPNEAINMEEEPLEAISAEAWPPSYGEAKHLDTDEESEPAVPKHDR